MQRTAARIPVPIPQWIAEGRAATPEEVAAAAAYLAQPRPQRQPELPLHTAPKAA